MSGRIRSVVPRIAKSFISNFVSTQQSMNFASAAAKEPKIKVHVAMFGGSGNYASVLYIVATKAKTLDKDEAELFDLATATEKSPTFSLFMKDLAIPADTRVKALTEICDKAKFSEVTRNFLVVLADKGRLKHVDTIIKRFSDLTMAHRGEAKAVVTTPLPDEEEKQMKDTLQEILGEGKKVKLEQKELRSMFEKQAGVEKFDLIQSFHACKQEGEGKSLNYNMHNMGKTIGEIHAMLIEYEKGLPKKAKTPQVNGKGKDKKVYVPKPNNPKPTAKQHPAKDDACHHYKEVGLWKRNCPVYLAELQKKRKQVGSAGFRIERKLKQGALYLYVGNGVRAQVEAIGKYDLVLTPNAYDR
ncbi:ATP synthase subunit O, mitochondrial [Tanacetum coccineum]